MKWIVSPACLALTAMMALSGGAAVAEEVVAIKNLLGTIGIIPQDKEPIHYRERAPLVLPPKLELREPEAGGRQARRDPSWPKDPEIAAREARAAEERSPTTSSQTRRMSERDGRLTVDELRQGRSVTGSNAPVPGSHRGDSARDVLYANPDGKRQAAATPDDGTPAARRTLADPPTGYRKTAGGGPLKRDFAPVVDQQTIDASPMAWLTRKFRGGDDDE